MDVPHLWDGISLSAAGPAVETPEVLAAWAGLYHPDLHDGIYHRNLADPAESLPVELLPCPLECPWRDPPGLCARMVSAGAII